MHSKLKESFRRLTCWKFLSSTASSIYAIVEESTPLAMIVAENLEVFEYLTISSFCLVFTLAYLRMVMYSSSSSAA